MQKQVMPFMARVALSPLFLISGLGKVAAPAATISYIAASGMPYPVIAYYGALLVELLGAVALLTGFKMRWAALMLIGYSIVATLFFHNELGDPKQILQALKNLAIIGGLLALTSVGPGRWALGRDTPLTR